MMADRQVPGRWVYSCFAKPRKPNPSAIPRNHTHHCETGITRSTPTKPIATEFSEPTNSHSIFYFTLNLEFELFPRFPKLTDLLTRELIPLFQIAF